MSLFLGCIADDFTGATDLASTLAAKGMRVALILGAPASRVLAPDADAVVIALKSRSIEPVLAVQQSLHACRWLRAHGAQRIFFKYCSTFDSTPRGNIGPVAAALAEAHDDPFTIACPALPENGRTVENGRLFVHGVPLNKSGMEKHPLNPMTDANLVRVLQRQTPKRIGRLPLKIVRSGAGALRAAAARLHATGVHIAIADAVDTRDLMRLGSAFGHLPLLTGASGLALGLPAAWRRAGLIAGDRIIPALPDIRGHAAVLAGSCSVTTLKQIAAWRSAGRPALKLNIAFLIRRPRAEVQRAITWAAPRLACEPVLIHASNDPDEVNAVQARHERESAGRAIEQVMASIARALVRRGVRRLVVAGGETSGAIASGLGVRVVRIGPSIAPGVPWTESIGKPALALALKSGNFGDTHFFSKALGMLP